MKSSVVVSLLVVLNVALLCATTFQSWSIRVLTEQQGEQERAELRKEQFQSAAAHARFAAKVDQLARLVGRLEQVGQGRQVPVDSAAPQGESGPAAAADVGSGPADERESASARPDPAKIPLLSEEELAHLEAKRDAMPALSLENIEQLTQGDVDSILSDKLWNPTGRHLEAREREELETLRKQYGYFTRLSVSERFEKWVQPELALLREAGAYVECRSSEAPPVLPGVKVSHAEPSSDKPGVDRVYYFHEEDYPELYHQYRVERQRGLETYVKIYELINGPIAVER